MNQVIQQNMIENKKPRIYVSWRIVLLNSLGLFVLTIALSIFCDSLFEGNHALPEMTGLINSLLFNAPFITIITGLLIRSIYRKPKGYVRTMYFNIALFFAFLFPILLFTIIVSNPLFWHPPSPTPPNVFLFLLKECISLVLLTILIVFAICFNRKFQKSEFELGITQA